MKDEDKTREQLISDLDQLRKRLAELEREVERRKPLEEAAQDREGEMSEGGALKSRRQAEAILRELPVAIGITILDDGTFLYANTTFQNLFGYTGKELIGRTSLEMGFYPSGGRERLVGMVQELGGVRNISGKCRCKDGTEKEIYLTAVPFAYQGRDCLLDIVIDVTEQKSVERGLRERDERLRMIFNLSQSGIILISPQGVITFANQRMADMFGCVIEELIGSSYTGRLHPDGIETSEEYLRKLISGELEIHCTERHYLRKDGSDFWGYLSGCRHEDDQGVLISLILIITDWTERKRAEKELLESSQRLELAVASGRLGIWDWDVQSNVMVWDNRMFELYGVSRETFSNSVEAWEKGLHPDDYARSVAESDAALSGERDFDTEFRVLHPDGSVKVLKADALVIRDKEGKAIRMIGLNRDITAHRQAEKELEEYRLNLEEIIVKRTRDLVVANERLEHEIAERKQAEQVVRESEERFRQIAETIPSVFWVAEKDLSVVNYVSSAYEKIWGRSCTSLYEDPLSWLESVHIEDRERVKLVVFKRGIKEFCCKYRIVQPDGSIRWIRDNGFGVTNSSGEVYRFIGLATDVTEQVAAEQKIAAALAEKEVLLREVHHRVKNNLASIIALAEMHLNRTSDEKTVESFRDFQTRIRAMALVHEDLYKSGNLAAIHVASYLRSLVDDILDVYGPIGSGVRLDVEDITLDIDKAIPCGLIVTELVTNTLKYAFPEGKPRCDSKGALCEVLLAFGFDGQFYTLSVSDNGVGLPPGFDWSLMNDSLGLRLVHMIATRQLNGSVEVDNRHGASFAIRFEGTGKKK